MKIATALAVLFTFGVLQAECGRKRRQPQANIISLLVYPSSEVPAYVPVSFTCMFDSTPLPQVVYLNISTISGHESVLTLFNVQSAIGTVTPLTNQVNVTVIGLTVTFVFSSVQPEDTGFYSCGSLYTMSNLVFLNVNDTGSSYIYDYYNLDYMNTDTPPTYSSTSGSLRLSNMRLTVSVSVSAAVSVVVLIVILVLRFRYGYRFGRGCSRRPPQTNANFSQPTVLATAQPNGYYAQEDVNKQPPVYMPPVYDYVAYKSYPVAGVPAGPTGVINPAYTVPNHSTGAPPNYAQ